MHLQEASPLSQGRNNYGKSHATKSPSVSMSQAESRLQGTSQFYNPEGHSDDEPGW